jgi:hypothetical protein
MQTATVIGFLSFLILVEPVSAANRLIVHELDVRVHEGVEERLDEDEVKTALENASDMLQRSNCNVKFKLRSIEPFGTSPRAPKDVADAEDLEAVHRVRGHVKVVQSITFCRPRSDDNSHDNSNNVINGCAFRHRPRLPTIILSRAAIRNGDGALWAHEFGHTRGLPHRDDQNALMFCQPGVLSGTTVTPAECRKIRRRARLPSPPPVTCSSER